MKVALLKGEKIQKEVIPHPISLMSLQSPCLFILVWGIVFFWLVHSQYWPGIENWLGAGTQIVALVIWWVVLLAGGVVASLLLVRWRIFFIYLGVLACGTVLMYWEGLQTDYIWFISIYSAIVSVMGFLLVDIYRRSHRYFITNFRLIFRGGILKKRERTLRYDGITDIESSQGILGRIFGFGTIIPITKSGFGLGEEVTFAGGGLEAGKKIGGKVFAGGGKGIQTPMTRSYYELHGVKPYDDVKTLLENLIQESTMTVYQREQVELQKQMRDLLEKQSRGGNDKSVKE